MTANPARDVDILFIQSIYLSIESHWSPGYFPPRRLFTIIYQMHLSFLSRSLQIIQLLRISKSSHCSKTTNISPKTVSSSLMQHLFTALFLVCRGALCWLQILLFSLSFCARRFRDVSELNTLRLLPHSHVYRRHRQIVLLFFHIRNAVYTSLGVSGGGGTNVRIGSWLVDDAKCFRSPLSSVSSPSLYMSLFI